MGLLHPDRLFPADVTVRGIARELYEEVAALPILSPHGHTDPSWFAENEPFANPTDLLLTPDHYVLRMLYSQGLTMQSLGIATTDGQPYERDPEQIWRTFADHYHLFRGTPSRLWMDYVFSEVFGLNKPLSPATAEQHYAHIDQQLRSDAFRPRALFDQFRIELLATTESPLDDLRHHRAIAASDWSGRIVTAYRPDEVIDPDLPEFPDNVRRLAALTDMDCSSYDGYLQALRARRQFFIEHGATSTDHGHASAMTCDLPTQTCERLYQLALTGRCNAQEAEQFRGQMLTEMAGMSIEDGLVMQIHPGSWRNHNPELFERFGRDKGADIPMQTGYVAELKALLDRYGNHPEFSLIVFTLDETSYSRELAPLAGHYPCLKLGPPWWFHDSPNGMRRFRDQVTETAGFYNTVGFNDDTRAFLSIPARHDVARRMDCGYLAQLVAEHQLGRNEAHELAQDLAYNFVKRAYKL